MWCNLIGHNSFGCDVNLLNHSSLNYFMIGSRHLILIWWLTVFIYCFRYSIILQIFKEHAKTKVSKLQVALAEIPYIR
jgi:hypothetical protein